MSSLVVHSFHLCQPCRAVEWFIARNKIADVKIHITDILKGEHMSAEYTALNPLQTLPILRIDDKETIVESGAIMLHLSNLNGKKDQPEVTSIEYTRMMEALLFHESMGRVVSKTFILPVFVPKLKNSAGASLAKAKADAGERIGDLVYALQYLDARLERNGGFSAGSTFTLPDYLLAAEVTQIEVMKVAWPEGFSMDGYKNIAKFLEAIKTLDGYAGFVVPLEFLQKAMDTPWAA